MEDFLASPVDVDGGVSLDTQTAIQTKNIAEVIILQNQ